MIVPKKDFKLDEILVKIRVDMIGEKRTEAITCTASDACKLVDALNQNIEFAESVIDKEYLSKGYVVIDDKKAKNYVLLAFDYIKRLDIPYFKDDGDNFNFTELNYNVKG